MKYKVLIYTGNEEIDKWSEKNVKALNKKMTLPCGHDDLNRISHLGDHPYDECMFCDWRSDKPYTPRKTLESTLLDLIHDVNNLSVGGESRKQELNLLVDAYADELRKYAKKSMSRLGGEATLKRYGKEHFKKIAKGWPKGKKRKLSHPSKGKGE